MLLTSEQITPISGELFKAWRRQKKNPDAESDRSLNAKEKKGRPEDDLKKRKSDRDLDTYV